MASGWKFRGCMTNNNFHNSWVDKFLLGFSLVHRDHFSLITYYYYYFFFTFEIPIPLITCHISNCEIFYVIFMVLEFFFFFFLFKYPNRFKKNLSFCLISLLIVSFYNWGLELCCEILKFLQARVSYQSIVWQEWGRIYRDLCERRKIM